jgi:hypothetical protein
MNKQDNNMLGSVGWSMVGYISTIILFVAFYSQNNGMGGWEMLPSIGYDHDFFWWLLMMSS